MHFKANSANCGWQYDIDAIPVVESLDPATFFREYMHRNVPVLIGQSITAEWPAIRSVPRFLSRANDVLWALP
jgi:hypothetical protein